jgi:hypothetical protein
MMEDLGINLAGIEVILRMSQQIAELQRASDEMELELRRLRREKG